MKKRFDFPVLLLFSAVSVGFSGCGAEHVSVPERPAITVEGIDPFEYGDEFAFRPKTDAPQVSAGKVTGGKSVSSPVESGESKPAPRNEAVPQPVKETADSTGKTSAPSSETVVRQSGKVIYRVQIGIFEEQKSAEKRAEEARSKVDKEVRIEFEPPFYRVRVGDFNTRKEAEDYVKILQDYGFRGSFWVMKNVNTP